MKIKLLLILFFVSQTIHAQFQGVVKDSLSNETIPYVNIWVYNENVGTTANKNGEFILPKLSKGKILVFSAIGYKTKRIPYKSNLYLIKLQQDTVKLQEVVIKSKQKHKELTIGKFKRSRISFYFACFDKPWILARFFSYNKDYAATPYLKNITFFTNSDVGNAKFIVKLYLKAENGEPESYLFNKSIIGIAKKGHKRTKIDLSEYQISFPENGFFISVEWLIIEENKFVFKYTKKRRSIKKFDAISYEPSFGAVPDEIDKKAWKFNRGAWEEIRKINSDVLKRYEGKYPVLAIELTLTN